MNVKKLIRNPILYFTLLTLSITISCNMYNQSSQADIEWGKSHQFDCSVQYTQKDKDESNPLANCITNNGHQYNFYGYQYYNMKKGDIIKINNNDNPDCTKILFCWLFGIIAAASALMLVITCFVFVAENMDDY